MTLGTRVQWVQDKKLDTTSKGKKLFHLPWLLRYNGCVLDEAGTPPFLGEPSGSNGRKLPFKPVSLSRKKTGKSGTIGSWATFGGSLGPIDKYP